MFDQLSGRLKKTFDRLTSRGLLTELDVSDALREIRIALLEADVALPVIKRFMLIVKEKAVGDKVLGAVSPGQQIIKIVNDALVDVLGEAEELNLSTQPPAVIMMVGLQGSGKTTTTGKLAKLLKEKHNKKVLLASLDIYRPAAQEQLQTLAERVDVGSVEIIAKQKPLEITKRAIKQAKQEGYDVLFLDTAGRTEIDDTLMDELTAVKNLANPIEIMLIADSLTGQVAVKVADTFNQKIGITSISLTRMDGDGRGGAALSMREVTGCPIKYVGMGEGMGALETFRPESVANRILGMGDIVSLVEKVQEAASEEDMADMEEKFLSGKGFNLIDLRKQLKMMKKMGGLSSMMGLIPGMGKFKDKIDPSKIDDKAIIHQIAVIDSMTPQERKFPAILNAKRRKRIAAGAGVTVNVVNKLIKSHLQMGKMMKKMGGMQKKGKNPFAGFMPK
jgi:signal recognition particle subunit SRP54